MCMQISRVAELIEQFVYGMVWYGNCLFDKIKSTLKHNSKYRISES